MKNKRKSPQHLKPSIKPSKPGEPAVGWRLPTLEEGRVLALAASKGFFNGWRTKPGLFARAAVLLAVRPRDITEWHGVWVERRWSAPLRKLAAKADGAGALCGILIRAREQV